MPQHRVLKHLKGQRSPQRRHLEVHPITRAIATVLYTTTSRSFQTVANELNLQKGTVQKIVKKAKEKAEAQDVNLYTPTIYEDAPRSGRPEILNETQKAGIIEAVTKSRETRDFRTEELQKHATSLFAHLDLPPVSDSTIESVLYAAGYARRKHGWKFALTPAMKAARYKWALAHNPDDPDKPFDPRRVIYTDETAIKVGAERGYMRSWRKVDETYHPDVTRERSKKFSELHFWGCFTYGMKGPCHVYFPELEDEKKLASYLLAMENKARHDLRLHLEAVARPALALLDINVQSKRRNPDKMLIKDILKRGNRSRGGIDGYRHRESVLKPKLVPFTKKVERVKGSVKVLEDCAPAHISKFDTEYMSLNDIKKLLWPSNSPDINASEHAWSYMRRHITRDYPTSTTKEQCAQQWRDEWEKLPQEQIDAWIDRIPDVIRQIIAQKGGNNFHA